uniref:Uncharacterized protein n=1 Tax=Chelydra serpentina TaxID=8475 RepID=A0A8C3S3F2_CHESE
MNLSGINHQLGLKAYEQSWILAEKQSTFLTARFFWTQSMASWCKRCGQQVVRNLPFTVVRITEGEMRSYYDFLKKCIKLEKLGAVLSTTPAFSNVLVTFCRI